MAQKLIMSAPGVIAYEEVALAAPGPGQVRARTRLSAISHGTEMVSFLGKGPFLQRKFTGDRLFVPKEAGDPSHYPFRWAGYDLVAEVTAVGSGVTAYAVGDRVFCPVPHQSELLFAADNADVLQLPPAMTDEQALMLSLGTVAFVGVHDAEIQLGDSVAVFGGGMVGQLAAQLAGLSGATRVFLVEPNAERRAQAARRAGIIPIDPVAGPPALSIRALNEGRSPDVVLECSGAVKGLSAAVAAAGVGGTVVAVGFYAGPATDFSFGEEFLHNRVTLKASMGVWGCPARRPQQWHRQRQLHTVRQLLAEQRLDVAGFITLRVPFTEAQRAYEAVRDQPGHMKVVLTY